MRLQAWPKTGTAKRIYINDGRWSVDTWLEPHGPNRGWRLQITIKDGEGPQRRIEILTAVETQVFQALDRVLMFYPKPKAMAKMVWADWVEVARSKGVTTAGTNNYI